MNVRVWLVLMPEDDILRIDDAHPSHIFLGNLCHQLIIYFVFVLRRKTERYMPNEILHAKVGLCLYFETGSDGGIGCEAYSIGCHNHRIFLLDVVGIVD